MRDTAQDFRVCGECRDEMLTQFIFKLRWVFPRSLREMTCLMDCFPRCVWSYLMQLTMESESLSDILGDILVDIFRFMNRKDISNISLANRRWRDISRTHFIKYPLLSFGQLSIAKDVFGKRFNTSKLNSQSWRKSENPYKRKSKGIKAETRK
ncbi:hypothetical protein Ddc_10294 [Ditylenchus destructor]|nr:hypothetical protein Ddc_10294 [Ditylenchus destructor]